MASHTKGSPPPQLETQILENQKLRFMQKPLLLSLTISLVAASPLVADELPSPPHQEKSWLIDSDTDWEEATAAQTNLDFKDGFVTPTTKEATFQSALKIFDEKRSAASITIEQSPVWQNWNPTPKIAPPNLGDAPVTLSLGPDNYWIFGRYKAPKQEKEFTAEEAQLEGFDIPLLTTSIPHQYNAPGGLKKSHGGYHAWQSKDMVNWVHHGSVTKSFSSWVTTAEFADGKAYLYYDFPNDQDPHVYVDDNLTDGIPGKNMGMAFQDPSHGSDCAVIRDLEGKFHMIYEDWSPIDASVRSWDSPLAGHSVSPDGIANFEIQSPAVDERTTPTGKMAQYTHPHWHKADPENYPGKPVPKDIPQHRIKAGDIRAVGEYEIHEPEQNAYGDWASIAIGGQYYLFGDFDPAGAHGRENMSVAWFTSASIDQPFSFCGNIGQGHPDPDILFAEGQFYLVTQTKQDFVSPGPWVAGVEARVGVDIDKDYTIDQWTDWQTLNESYHHTPGFAKQVSKTPAEMDLSALPAGHGFQFEVRLSDTTENDAKPILDKVSLSFEQ